MSNTHHTLEDLFEQLGLHEDYDSIERFIENHRPLPEQVSLAEADFWSASQAAFLEEALSEDSDWAMIVDHLDNLLRSD